MVPATPSLWQPQIASVKKLVGRVPVFGICLGHRSWAWRSTARRSSSSSAPWRQPPVLNKLTGRVEITSQTTGLRSPESLKDSEIELTHFT